MEECRSTKFRLFELEALLVSRKFGESSSDFGVLARVLERGQGDWKEKLKMKKIRRLLCADFPLQLES